MNPNENNFNKMTSIKILNFYKNVNILYKEVGNFSKNIKNNNNNKNNNSITKKFREKLFVLSFGKKLNNSNTKIVDIVEIYNYLNKIISDGLDLIKHKESEGWVYCSSACNYISRLFKTEINSTLYMLNVISNSLVTIDESSIDFVFNGSIDDLKGDWESDKNKFTFKINYKDGLQRKGTRLIMGFGPSASGKTYCAKAIISMLSNNDPNFPKSFLSIDGGTYREKSYIYQQLIQLVKPKKFNGLKNLVLSGHHLKISKKIVHERESLFEAGIIKKKITEYLLERKEPISLYIPETLGGCVLDCSSVYSKYIDIAKDSENWIGLLIWQHKEHKDCDYIEGYKCSGCTESGKKREKNEGKIYSSSAWENSMRNGRYHMMLAPGGKYEIHNGGNKDSKSVIINHSPNKPLNKISNGFELKLPANIKNIKIVKKKTLFNTLKKIVLKSNVSSVYNIKSNNIKRRVTL